MSTSSAQSLALYDAAIELHEGLWLCFNHDRDLCSSQTFEDIANALLGMKGDHGMSNLNLLACKIRNMEKAFIAFNYKT